MVGGYLLFGRTDYPSVVEVVAVAVGVYAVAIVATMGALGAGVGYLYGLVGGVNRRVHGAHQVATGVVLAGVALPVVAGAL